MIGGSAPTLPRAGFALRHARTSRYTDQTREPQEWWRMRCCDSMNAPGAQGRRADPLHESSCRSNPRAAGMLENPRLARQEPTRLVPRTGAARRTAVHLPIEPESCRSPRLFGDPAHALRVDSDVAAARSDHDRRMATQICAAPTHLCVAPDACWRPCGRRPPIARSERHGDAAVDRQNLARDVARILGAQEEGRPGDVVGRAGAAERDLAV